MTYLDEMHARATIESNALPHYHRVTPTVRDAVKRAAAWLRKVLAREWPEVKR